MIDASPDAIDVAACIVGQSPELRVQAVGDDQRGVAWLGSRALFSRSHDQSH